jgi:hypothetical protein
MNHGPIGPQPAEDYRPAFLDGFSVNDSLGVVLVERSSKVEHYRSVRYLCTIVSHSNVEKDRPLKAMSIRG